MSEHDQTWHERARAARAQLEPLAMPNPDVRMVSIGIDPERRSAQPVLIVTLRHGAVPPANIPNDVNGIPVRIVYGDYQLEQGE